MIQKCYTTEICVNPLEEKTKIYFNNHNIDVYEFGTVQNLRAVLRLVVNDLFCITTHEVSQRNDIEKNEWEICMCKNTMNNVFAWKKNTINFSIAVLVSILIYASFFQKKTTQKTFLLQQLIIGINILVLNKNLLNEIIIFF